MGLLVSNTGSPGAKEEMNKLFKAFVAGSMALLVAFLLPCFVPNLLIGTAHAQIHGDNGVSNWPGGGFVFGYVDTTSTNYAGTNFVVRQTRRPLGFFGNHSTNWPNVTTNGVSPAQEVTNIFQALIGLGLIQSTN